MTECSTTRAMNNSANSLLETLGRRGRNKRAFAVMRKFVRCRRKWTSYGRAAWAQCGCDNRHSSPLHFGLTTMVVKLFVPSPNRRGRFRGVRMFLTASGPRPQCGGRQSRRKNDP